MKFIHSILIFCLGAGFTPFIWASEVQPPERYFSGHQLELAKAIARGNVKEVTLLAPVTKLNQPGKEDMTLLFYAMLNSYDKDFHSLSIVSRLFYAGADPLQQVPDAGSVAEIASRSDDPVFIAALIEGGMDPNAEIDETPILFGASSDHSQRVMQYLVVKGADVNKTDYLGQTVLIEALSGLQLDSVIWLLRHDAGPRIKKGS